MLNISPTTLLGVMLCIICENGILFATISAHTHFGHSIYTRGVGMDVCYSPVASFHCGSVMYIYSYPVRLLFLAQCRALTPTCNHIVCHWKRFQRPATKLKWVRVMCRQHIGNVKCICVCACMCVCVFEAYGCEFEIVIAASWWGINELA